MTHLLVCCVIRVDVLFFFLCVFPVEVWKQKILGVKIILFFLQKRLIFFFEELVALLSYRDGIGNGCLCMVGLVNILKFFVLSNKYIYEFGYLTGVRGFGV